MILIFTEKISYSAKYVARQLYKLKQPFVVFLEDDFIDFNYNISNNTNKVTVYKNSNKICYLEDVKSVWAHRSPINIEKKTDYDINEEEIHYANQHYEVQKNSIKYFLENKKCLGRFDNYNFNKIEFLDACTSLDLKIPNTLITRSKKDVMDFLNTHNDKIIVKSLGRNFSFRNEKKEEFEIWQKGVTNLVTPKSVKKLPMTFDLSLFQEKVNKKYELRILYVAGKFFSQVIFSQKDEISRLDYREGLGSLMRQCNFVLPKNLEKKINKLMKKLDLNIGCIDIVVNKNNEFVFLEVNPSGIFTDMMDNCNYNMHYEIAKYLIDEK